MGTSLQVTPSYEDDCWPVCCWRLSPALTLTLSPKPRRTPTTSTAVSTADIAATSATPTGPMGVTTATDHMPTACTDARRGRLSPQRLPSLRPTPKLVRGTSTAATMATPGHTDTDTTATDPTTVDTMDTMEDKYDRIETLTNVIQQTRGHSVYNKDINIEKLTKL